MLCQRLTMTFTNMFHRSGQTYMCHRINICSSVNYLMHILEIYIKAPKHIVFTPGNRRAAIIGIWNFESLGLRQSGFRKSDISASHRSWMSDFRYPGHVEGRNCGLRRFRKSGNPESRKFIIWAVAEISYADQAVPLCTMA